MTFRAYRIGWLGGVALFLAGCVVTLWVLRYWHGPGSLSLAPVVQQTSKSRWRFEADFKLPTSIIVRSPDKTEILSFDIRRSKNPPLEPYPVEIRNLSDHAYPVTYQIFAYDAQHRRVDTTTDGVTIGGKETVLRNVDFDHPLSVDARTFTSFRLIADIEH
jgi:hypothetical protein